MNPLALVAKILMVSAINQHGQNKAEQRLQECQQEAEEYLMTFFRGPIVDIAEQNWILTQKIHPKVMQMTPKELSNLISKKHKNAKLIQNGKPAKYVIVKNSTIQDYHQEYLIYCKKKAEAQARQARDQERARQAAREASIRELRFRQMREAEILVNGESDADIAQKLFD